MLCCRVLLLIFIILATACAICANFFPAFRKSSGNTTYAQTLWYRKTAVDGVEKKGHLKDSKCDQYKLHFQIAEGLALAVVITGFILFALAIAQLATHGKRGSLRCWLILLISLSFAACGGCLALLVYGYLKGYCQDKDTTVSAQYASFKDQDYKFAEAMYFISAAFLLFLMSLFAECGA